MLIRKPMTTKEIIFDSKNLPVNIDEVEWVLRGDLDIAIEALKKCTNAHLRDGRFIDVAEEALDKILTK